MTILFDSARPVKSARPFGVSARTDRRMPYTSTDLEWAAYELNKDATDFDVLFPIDSDLTAMAWAEALDSELDRMAGEFEAQARMGAGYSLF